MGFLFFSLYSFSCIASNSTTLKDILILVPRYALRVQICNIHITCARPRPLQPRHNNSNIRTLIHFKMIERQNSFMQYCVPYKWSFWEYISVKKIMLAEFRQRHTFMKHPYNLRWYIIRKWHVSILCQLLCVVLTRLQDPVNDARNDVRLTHLAMQDSHLHHSRVLMEITHTVIIATRTRI